MPMCPLRQILVLILVIVVVRLGNKLSCISNVGMAANSPTYIDFPAEKCTKNQLMAILVFPIFYKVYNAIQRKWNEINCTTTTAVWNFKIFCLSDFTWNQLRLILESWFLPKSKFKAKIDFSRNLSDRKFLNFYTATTRFCFLRRIQITSVVLLPVFSIFDLYIPRNLREPLIYSLQNFSSVHSYFH